ncbi:unnamed protein product (macronuclear) [Paramecium tetraurelia]|uniref:Cyclic nucleotide-binding domain-containing protein n=1 Tax=Paramecium tetraurelia TaxID=5888 RepID=A0EIQ4_PARTE|nr:uncharacterized protein GSPATT00027524001 [Paramecium tetraurelia]CAK95195.1 unnamed protein product [Paramecium tetraurelia]|eukprot:XP_001462568.1 hypothetical protein (macronuclear) [Paramecium tetraurelia strain d4-2]
MRFEQFHKNQVIFSKNQLDQSKLIIVLSGDVVLNKGNQEMIHLKHFGSNLLLFGSECYSDISDWNVTSKTVCKLAAISKHDFRVNLMNFEVSRITKEISQLYAFPIFKNVPYAQVRRFYANSMSQNFQCLDIVYLQEQMIKQIYLVIKGIFELRELEKGVAKAVHIFTQGQLIGENELNNKTSLCNGTAFCISEEGQLLIFDHDFFKAQVLPTIEENLPNKCKTQVSRNEKVFNNKVSLTGEIMPKKTLSRHYNFKKSSEDVEEQQKQTVVQKNQIRSTHSINSVHQSQSNNSEDLNESQINNLNSIANPSQNKQSAVFNRLRMGLRNTQKSVHLQNEQLRPSIINSPVRSTVNRQSSFQLSLQKMNEEAAIKKQMNLRMPLKNELLYKFLNRKEEYGDIAAKNRMRRTLSQTTNVKKPLQINK